MTDKKTCETCGCWDFLRDLEPPCGVNMGYCRAKSPQEAHSITNTTPQNTATWPLTMFDDFCIKDYIPKNPEPEAVTQSWNSRNVLKHSFT